MPPQDESQDKLEYVLTLSIESFLERRLQTLVFKLGLAKSVHHARVLIRQRHIRCAHTPPSRPCVCVCGVDPQWLTRQPHHR